MKHLVLTLLALTILPLPAHAESKYFFNMFWPARHFKDQDFRPYMQDPMLHQNRQWDSDGWSPQNWVHPGKSAEDVIDGFFRTGLLEEQDVNCDGIPTLKVGEPFLHLSYREQNRIAAFMDYAYGITSANSGGAYYLTYRRRADVIGVYTPSGLQMH
ncbi:MAG: hypothetical protein LRZ85_04540 [Alphaproteobacteria bacterium]|nr:hypothetical protein [Alphaproteobacteria bacterium]MCD8571465.1 hypothetical protein [Alphaproteobacteria bacterium]